MQKMISFIRRTWPAALLPLLAVAFLALSGDAAAQDFTPPAVSISSTTTPYTGYSGLKSVAVDASGNIVYLAGGGSGQLVELPANGGAPITLVSGLNYPKSMAIDNAGNAYAGDYSGHLWKVAIGGGTPVDIMTACNSLDGGYLGEHLVATDGLGNVYTGGNNSTSLFRITAGGVCSIVSGVTLNDTDGSAATGWEDGYSRVAADKAGNLYYSVQNSLYTIPVGASTPVLVTSNFANNCIIGLSTDAQGNVYVTNVNLGSYSGLTYEVPFVNGVIHGDAMFVVLPFASAYDVGVDASGTIYTTDSSNISLSTVGKLRFPDTAVGEQSAASTVSLYFNSAQTISSFAFQSGAGTTGEVVNTGAGNCATGTAYTAGQSCTLTLDFAPAGVGARNASLQVLSGSSILGEAAMSGQGLGAALTVDPGTQSSLGSGWTLPAGIAADSVGNLFLSDATAGTVSMIPAGSTTATQIAQSLQTPSGLAVGADGTVYVTVNGGLVAIPFSNGAYGAAANVISGMKTPVAVAVSGSGDVYVADEGAGQVYRIPNNAGVIDSSAMQTFGSGFTAPSGLAFDAAGNLYVTDKTAGKVFKLTGATQSAIVSGLSSPLAIAVDAGSSLYLAQSGSTTIQMIPYSGSAYNINSSVQLGSDLTAPSSVAVDMSGNLYVADGGNASAVRVVRTAGTLSLGRVNLNESSATESLTLSSAGNQALTFGSILYAASGNTGDFNVSPACLASGSLPAGESCQIAGTFAPTMTGQRAETLTIASNAVNASTITGSFTGVGINLLSTKTTLSQVTSGKLTFGEAVQFSVAVVPANGAGAPTGTVQFIVNGSNYGAAVSLSSGTASITVKGLPAGNNAIGATYSGDENYAGSSAASFTANVALATTNTLLSSSTNSGVPVPPGTSVTLTAEVSSSVVGANPTGTVNFMAGTTSLGVASLDASGTAAVTSTAFPQGTYAITAVYSGDSGFATSTSSPVSIAILPPQFTFNSTPGSLSVSTAGSSTTSFTITPISGYTGSVDLQCSGLPANTVCNFTPGIVSFENTQNASGGTVAPGAQSVNLNIVSGAAPATTVASFWLLGCIPLLMIIMLRRRMGILARFGTALSMLLVGAGLMAMSGCNSNQLLTPSGSKTVTVTLTGSPSGTSTIQVNGDNNIVRTFSFTLNVQ
jgi:sugar lactone lactonase YvrE